MYARVRKSKDGTSRMVWHPEPGDLEVTGTSSDGRHTTFSSGGKHHFTARNIHEDEAFWLAAILLCIVGACIVLLIELNSSPGSSQTGPLFLLSVFGVGLFAKSIREEASAWKEVLFLIATVILLGNRGDSGALLFAVITYGFLLIRYAWLWKERAVWEPCVFLALFCGTLLVYRTVNLPDLLAMLAFMCIASGSFVGLITVLSSGWAYTRGYNSISE